MNEVTRIISAIQHEDGHATEKLLPLVYEKLGYWLFRKWYRKNQDKHIRLRHWRMRLLLAWLREVIPLGP
jgi:hypothetical protein